VGKCGHGLWTWVMDMVAYLMPATWMGCSRWVEKLADGGSGISETTVVSAC